MRHWCYSCMRYWKCEDHKDCSRFSNEKCVKCKPLVLEPKNIMEIEGEKIFVDNR